MSFQSLAYPTRESLTGALKQTVSMPFLEGAGGIVAGIIVGDYAANFFVTTFNTTGAASLAVKGASKIGVSGLLLYLTSASKGSIRILGLGVALGSVSSFLVDLIAASPFAKQLGLSYAQARQVSARDVGLYRKGNAGPTQFNTG